MPLPPPYVAVAVGLEHTLAQEAIVSGVSGALRVGRGPVAAELGGTLALDPYRANDTWRALYSVLPSGVIEQRNAYAVRLGADFGYSQPGAEAADEGRAWGSPHLLVAADAREVTYMSVEEDGTVLASPIADEWTFGPTVGVGLAAGVGRHLGARFLVLGNVPVIGPAGPADPVGTHFRAVWSSHFELVLSL